METGLAPVHRGEGTGGCQLNHTAGALADTNSCEKVIVLDVLTGV